ncbi:superoxide dismutase family protein [Corynebacterium halotolerans]|uniref:superoxide dismutase family protein n=1 Tax=Corynebacterium halotolerans TaxID=225326 RepID=UPI003CF446B3
MSVRLTSRTRLTTALLAAPLLLALGACAEGTESAETETTTSGDQETVADDAAGGSADATADLTDTEGNSLGTVNFTEADGMLTIQTELSDLEPGFHGFHIHETGACEPDFAAAGSHLDTGDTDHPDHAGDLPSLLVMEDGSASLQFATDRLSLADLDDEDGAAVIVHSDADNYANIPDRYAPEGADEDTTSAGDSGDRVACGTVNVG